MADSVTRKPVPQSAHTPGPWVVEVIPDDAHTDPDFLVDDDQIFWIAQEPGWGHTVAAVYQIPGDLPRASANARLIAAAPDLLAALCLILADPHGCPMCDSGQLRNPQKEHSDSCGFARVS